MLFEEMKAKEMTREKKKARLKDLPREISDSFFNGYLMSESFGNLLKNTIDMFLNENLDITHSFYLYRTALILVLTELNKFEFHISKETWDKTQHFSKTKQRMNIAIGEVTDDGIDIVVNFVGEDED